MKNRMGRSATELTVQIDDRTSACLDEIQRASNLPVSSIVKLCIEDGILITAKRFMNLDSAKRIVDRIHSRLQ